MDDQTRETKPILPVPDIHASQREGGGEESGFILRRMLETRTLTVAGGVNEKLATRVMNQLLVLEADDPEKPITLLLNSPGGAVNDGYAIFDMIRFVRPRVRIVCVGLAASIATVILLAPQKEDRLALPNTRLLIHQPLIPMHVFGPASDLEITAREILKTRDKINRLLAEETGQPLERVERDTQRDHWLSAEEALEYGLISRIIRSRADL